MLATSIAIPLWLAGNRRSDTLPSPADLVIEMLWLAGNRRSDTLAPHVLQQIFGCGLQEIVVRIHCNTLWVIRKSSCGLQEIVVRIHFARGYIRILGCCGLQEIVVRIHYCRWPMSLLSCCGLQEIVVRIHFTWLPRVTARPLWLAGNRRSDTLRPKRRFALLMLWLAGNRRSDTLAAEHRVCGASCGLQEIVVRIHSRLWRAGRRRCCGLQEIVVRIHFPDRLH